MGFGAQGTDFGVVLVSCYQVRWPQDFQQVSLPTTMSHCMFGTSAVSYRDLGGWSLEFRCRGQLCNAQAMHRLYRTRRKVRERLCTCSKTHRYTVATLRACIAQAGEGPQSDAWQGEGPAAVRVNDYPHHCPVGGGRCSGIWGVCGLIAAMVWHGKAQAWH